MSTASSSRPTRLILVRHGESEGNRDRRFTQHANVPLTPFGRDQAHATAEHLSRQFRPARLVSSPFARARETAEILAAILGLPVELEPALREQSFGVFAGQPYTALLSDAAYHDGPRWDWRPPGGESLTDVSVRVVPAFERIASESAGNDVVLVSHGGVMLALCAHVSGTWEGVGVAPNGGIVVIESRGGCYLAPTTIEPPGSTASRSSSARGG